MIYHHIILVVGDEFGYGGSQFSPDSLTLGACSGKHDAGGSDAGACYLFSTISCSQHCKVMPDDIGVFYVHITHSYSLIHGCMLCSFTTSHQHLMTSMVKMLLHSSSPVEGPAWCHARNLLIHLVATVEHAMPSIVVAAVSCVGWSIWMQVW